VSPLVRVCPVCDAENPPERTRCACGASLAGVDFALPHDDPSSLRKPGPGDRSSLRTQGPSDVTPLNPGVRGDDRRICPHADCGQANAADATRCVYCNRPLLADVAPPPHARPLPRALAGLRVVEVFPATGSEADVLLVEDAQGSERSVVKLYRKGIDPDFRLLDLLAGSAGATVVRVLDHGTSDGVAYERLEYVPGGTLADYLREGPLAATDVRGIVREIADALTRIHAHRILHRDLKPENVLVRSRAPLALALTDFGIASLAAATQHFTSAARTTKYAAPEVLTGVIDAQADWWSLGMIALEAATGRHPFDGLTEQVMNHQLATRPVDVRAVYDDDLRKLCRGLLLRDPRRRFGAQEVARWLAGDTTFAAPEESDTVGATVKPYRIGGAECTSAAELALTLAGHWDDARKDLARGPIARWIEQELGDYNLLRTLRDLGEDRALSDDARVLRFLRAACPTLPPVWRGEPLSRDTLLAQVRKAQGRDGDAIRWLDSLWHDRALAAFPEAEDLAALDREWRAAWQRFTAAWERGHALHAAARADASRRPDREGTHVDFDTVAYGHAQGSPQPAPHDVHADLLLAQHDPAFAAALHTEVAAARARLVDAGSWLDGLVAEIGNDPAGLVAARGFLDAAKDDADAARRRADAAGRARERDIAALTEALRARVKSLLEAAPEDEDISAATASALDEGFAQLSDLCQRLAALDLTDDAHAALRTSVEKLEVQGFAVRRTLAELAHDRGVTRVFLSARLLPIVAFALLVALMTRNGWIILATLAVPGGFAVYRWYTRFQATDAVLAALRRFRLPARTLMREGPAAPTKDAKKPAG